MGYSLNVGALINPTVPIDIAVVNIRTNKENHMETPQNMESLFIYRNPELIIKQKEISVKMAYEQIEDHKQKEEVKENICSIIGSSAVVIIEKNQ